MKVVLRKRHPKGFWVVFRTDLDLNVIFKKRDRDWFNLDRDFCVYVWKDPSGLIQYIGMGRYYQGELYSVTLWKISRPFMHKNDLLSNVISDSWICEILCYGCSNKEAHIIEAQLITLCDRPLSKRGQTKWDGVSLINKRRERKYENMIEEYLSLDGNNYWETLRREINGY